MSGILTSLREVSKIHFAGRQSHPVLRAVNLDVLRGENLSLVGANGSGKSTLLRILLGIDAMDSGTISPSLIGNERLAYIPQDYRNALCPWFTVQKNLELIFESRSHSWNSSFSTQDMLTKATALADALGFVLPLAKFPYQMSGGEQQILLLIRSLLALPTVLVMDEALSAVDLKRRYLVSDLLTEWAASNAVTIIASSHNLEEAAFLSQRIVVLSHVTGKIKEVISNPLPWPRPVGIRENPEFRHFINRLADAILC